MSVIGISEYNEAERKAIARIPNRIIQAFQPVLFQEVGYPFRVQNEYELFRYVDVMHELGFEREFLNLLGGITADEFELLKRITGEICSFSEKEFQAKAVARSCVINSLNIVRHIRYLTGTARPRIFEIGAGCGYLGAALALQGYPYAATDISQAFYLYQNRLWNHFAAGNVFEMVHDRESYDRLSALPGGSIFHMPWWEFVKLRPEKLPRFDIVTCNHALCEMHPASLRFTVKIAEAFLQESGSLKAFIFEGWGWAKNNSVESVTEVFYKNGFLMVYCDQYITVFVPAGTAYSMNALKLPRQVQSENLHIQNGSLVSHKKIVDSYQPEIYRAPENPVTTAIDRGRLGDKKTVGIDQVTDFYTGVLESNYHLTGDEDFQKIIDYTW